MTYKLLIISLLFLVFNSCIEENSTIKTKPIQHIEKVSHVDKKATKEVEKEPIGDISGAYELIKGYTRFIGSDDSEMYKSELIIERLSKTDFGFYSAYKVKGISPVRDFGVLRNYKNTFHNLAVCKAEVLEGYSEGNFTNGNYLHNQVIIQKKGDTLAVIRYGGNFRRYMLYKKMKAETKSSIYLVKSLESAEYRYDDFLRAYKKAENFDKRKLQIEYVVINDSWMTKHTHKEAPSSFEKTHFYQNPSPEGKFIKEDSIFWQLLKH